MSVACLHLQLQEYKWLDNKHVLAAVTSGESALAW
jgi:hypothetical protein